MDFRQIKAVTFDAGGTLIEPWPSVGHVYSAVAAELGYGVVSPEKLNGAFAQAWRLKQGFDYSLSAWFRLVEEVFAPHLPGPVSPKLFDALYQRFTCSAVWRVYDDVQPTLEALRQGGYRLAVISNWDERLKPLLSDLRLSDYFEAVVLSIDIGVAKPSSQIFAQTLNLLNLAPAAVLHIGDSVEEDVSAPQQCGIPALLLDRGVRTRSHPANEGHKIASHGEACHFPRDNEADLSLSSLTDLLSILPSEGLRGWPARS